MKTPNRILAALTTAYVAGLPTIAMAGAPTGPYVVLRPLDDATAPGGGSMVEAVPALGPGLMVALGVLLAVIGIRFMRQKGAQQKLMSLLVLGGGLLVGGLGVQDSRATSVTVAADNTVCEGATVSVFPDRGDGFDDSGEFSNNCAETTVVIASYEDYPCPPGDMIHTDLPPGTEVPPGAQNLNLSYCPSEER